MCCVVIFIGASSLIAAVFAQQQQQHQLHQTQENLNVEGASSNEAPIQKIKSEHSSSSMLLLQPQVSWTQLNTKYSYKNVRVKFRVLNWVIHGEQNSHRVNGSIPHVSVDKLSIINFSSKGAYDNLFNLESRYKWVI